jgi:ribosomal protein S18 acetylase RimI-like enzyme
VNAVIRPDGRRFVRARDLAGAITGEVFCTVDESDADALALCQRLSFVVNRRESRFLIPTDPDVTGLCAASVPEGFDLVRADEVDLDRLRLLDDALRQDVPGTDGWRWDEAGFRAEFDGAFEPETYLIAVDEATGEYAGLVRVWRNPSGPRLGMIGVLRRYRRRGLARALLARAFAVLHAQGLAEVSTEIDDANVASNALLQPLGARRTGGSVELVRR